jgi:hypothetical protein
MFKSFSHLDVLYAQLTFGWLELSHVAMTLNQGNIIAMEQIASDKSSLLLKIEMKTTQTLQLFTEINKAESMYKCNRNAKLEGLVDETKWSN